MNSPLTPARWNLKTGELNFRAMELLDKPTPAPTAIRPDARARHAAKGKAILVSATTCAPGAVLKQTEARDQRLYAREMLPAHGYPELRKYCTCAATMRAWHDQAKVRLFPADV